jgi:hypothetical protein
LLHSGEGGCELLEKRLVELVDHLWRLAQQHGAASAAVPFGDEDEDESPFVGLLQVSTA